MRERDKAILRDLARFRCLTRDHVAAVHFNGLKRAVTQANAVLKRLRRDALVDVSTDRRKYLYFPSPATIRKDSAKIPHYLAIADFYMAVCQIQQPMIFEVEPKLGEKGYPEPDVFMIWRGRPFYVEIQLSQIPDKAMKEKMKRYERLYLTDAWKDFVWQPKPPNRPYFPYVWLISEHRYNAVAPFKLFQTRTVDELLQRV